MSRANGAERPETGPLFLLILNSTLMKRTARSGGSGYHLLNTATANEAYAENEENKD
jgi:hypothetical protein